MSSTYVVPGADAPKEDLAASGRWGESIARSRSRRRAAARQRRRRFRSRGALVAVAGALVLSAGGAGVASADSSYLTVGSEGDQVSAVEQALGLPADGYFDEATARAVRNFQSENGLTIDGIVGPETSGALGLSSGGTSSESTSSSGGSASTDVSPALEQIAQCESGGDPTAVSADGQYRGKYQFSMETWQAMGGSVFAVLDRLLGRQGNQGAELQSYLLFDTDFMERLIEHGRAAGRKAWERGWLTDRLP